MNAVKPHHWKQYWMLIGGALVLLWLLAGLGGCGGYGEWDRSHERTYGVSYDADSRTGAVSMTIRPAATASAAAPAPAAGLNDETIAQIVKIIYAEAAKKQSAGILDTPALK